MADAAANIASVTQIREDLRKHGYAIYRQLLSNSAVERARKHLEAVVERHLSAAEEVGELVDVCAGLPFEQRLATAYSQCPVPGARTMQLGAAGEALLRLPAAPLSRRRAHLTHRSPYRSRSPPRRALQLPRKAARGGQRELSVASGPRLLPHAVSLQKAAG